MLNILMNISLLEEGFRGIQEICPPGQTESRIDSLKKTMLAISYEYVARSLFKSDRLMLAMEIVHGMYQEMFVANEWEFFTGLLVESDHNDKGVLLLFHDV